MGFRACTHEQKNLNTEEKGDIQRRVCLSGGALAKQENSGEGKHRKEGWKQTEQESPIQNDGHKAEDDITKRDQRYSYERSTIRNGQSLCLHQDGCMCDTHPVGDEGGGVVWVYDRGHQTDR